MNFIFTDAATQMKHVPRSLKKGPMVTALKSIYPFMRPLFQRNMRTSCWHALVHCILSHTSYLVSLTEDACLKIFSMLKPYDDVSRFCAETSVQAILDLEYPSEIIDFLCKPFGESPNEKKRVCKEVNHVADMKSESDRKAEMLE